MTHEWRIVRLDAGFLVESTKLGKNEAGEPVKTILGVRAAVNGDGALSIVRMEMEALENRNEMRLVH